MCYSFLILTLCSSISLARSNFGQNGWDGRDGWTGNHGLNGQDVTVVATGQNEIFDARGTDGRDGGWGDQGGDATGCSQPMNVPYNLQGASGGSGGRGGAGGNGGHGGSLIAYYEQAQNLKNIRVAGTPGRGAYGGRGGYGGRPCYCSLHSWTINNSSGNSQTYYCQNGQQGQNGWTGNQGTTGSYGTLSLIPQLTALSPTQPSVTIRLEETETSPILLSTNVWQSQSGARQLFAPGSDISDTYRQFLARIEHQYTFAWNVARPVTDFVGTKIFLELSPSGAVKQTLSGNLWTIGHAEHPAPNQTRYVFDGAVKPSEAEALSFSSVSGSGRDLAAKVSDTSGHQSDFATDFYLEYATRSGIIGYKTRFSGNVDPAYIQAGPGDFKIEIGKLAISSEYLSNVRARVFLRATRKFGSHSVKKEFSRIVDIN